MELTQWTERKAASHALNMEGGVPMKSRNTLRQFFRIC